MTCRNCNEQDNFCDGNADEELCKHCLDHSCEECFKTLESDLEYDTHLCEDCYEGPQHFTFFDWEIKEYEEEQEQVRNLQIACEKLKKEKAKKAKESVLAPCLANCPLTIPTIRKLLEEEKDKKRLAELIKEVEIDSRWEKFY